ncbi:dynein axonemal intermediate chain 3 isoform X2 [Parasteatoda tepidariorum]|uniref:dynein axonemal intermediate chain 3 isoform X2 n=1 Tax=Parasteatoda tepidariorum TaxID=114398 RepID=UPI0039BCC226
MNSKESIEASLEEKTSTNNFKLQSKEALKDEPQREFNSKIEILVELAQDDLRPFVLSDCYATDQPGMQLEILPKIIFDALDEDTEEDAIDLPKPIFRQTIEQQTQASVVHKNSSAQTIKRRLVNSWCQYEPRLFSEDEKEEHMIESSFQSFLVSAEKRILTSLMQNSIADIFHNDLNSLCDNGTVTEEKESLIKVIGSFICPESTEKKQFISSIHWHALFKDLFIASNMSTSSFEEQASSLLRHYLSPVCLFIWSARNQFSPKFILSCSDEVRVVKFNPCISGLIIGGTISGKLVLWDIKSKLLRDCSLDEEDVDNFYHESLVSSDIIPCCAASSLDSVHVYGITHLEWIPSHFEVSFKGVTQKLSTNTCFQIVSCSLNGLIQFWDLRLGFPYKANVSLPKKYSLLDGIWEPFHSMQLMSPDGKEEKSLTCFSLRENTEKDFEENIQEEENSDLLGHETVAQNNDIYADFYGGCADGAILSGTFKLFKDEAGKYVAKVPEYYQSPHCNSVSVIKSSPFIKDIFLSAGGKTVALWKHGIKTKPIFMCERLSNATSGEWSPTKPALLFIGFENGSIEMWDLSQNIYEPIAIHFISTSSINCLAIQQMTGMEYLVAAGDSVGVVHTMSLPPSFWQPLENELLNVKDFIEKETTRINEMETVALDGKVSRENKKELELPEKGKIEIEDEMKNAYKNFLILQDQQLFNVAQKESEEETSD